MQALLQLTVHPCALAANTQTIRGKKKAKSTTKEEFTDVMKVLVEYSHKLLKQVDENLQPLFSYDNNRIQAYANMESMGISPEERLVLPPWSPDMHKVIEHTFAQLKAHLQADMLTYNPARLTAHMAHQKVLFGFMNGISKEGIRKDVESMPATWHIISSPAGVLRQGPDGRYYMGTGGEWADTGHR